MENRIPPPLVATLFGVLMWLAAGYLPGALKLTSEWRLGLALVVLLAGAAISLAGVLSFRHARTTVNPLKPQTASALVRSGVFGFVMYMNRFQIGPQERALASLFGDAFTQYCSQVRRWL